MTISNEHNIAQCWENPNEPFLLNVIVDVNTNVYPKMLFGNPITEMKEDRKFIVYSL